MTALAAICAPKQRNNHRRQPMKNRGLGRNNSNHTTPQSARPNRFCNECGLGGCHARPSP
jgi:hypothetical protein